MASFSVSDEFSYALQRRDWKIVQATIDKPVGLIEETQDASGKKAGVVYISSSDAYESREALARAFDRAWGISTHSEFTEAFKHDHKKAPASAQEAHETAVKLIMAEMLAEQIHTTKTHASELGRYIAGRYALLVTTRSAPGSARRQFNDHGWGI